eukprot:3948603-Ditylum_brightwellii.AAC.1
MDGFLLYCHNPQNPCTFNNSQYVQWTPTDKTAPVKVMTTDGTLTLQAFMQQGHCLIATNGSAINNMISFAWK